MGRGAHGVGRCSERSGSGERSASRPPYPGAERHAGADIDRKEKRKVAELIIRNANVFSKHEYDSGVTTLASYHIDTGNHWPILEPFRRHSKIYLNVIDDSINRLVDAGICEPCSSLLASNIVPRVTVYFRKLKKGTIKDSFHCLVFLSRCA